MGMSSVTMHEGVGVYNIYCIYWAKDYTFHWKAFYVLTIKHEQSQ